jgi:hypothetical protein
MRANRVIVCQDYRPLALTDVAEISEINALEVDEELREMIRIKVNRDLPLIEYLKGRKYQVRLFDGYANDLMQKLRDPKEGAAHLGKLIDDTQSDGIIYDLHYFDNYAYGIEMLKALIARGHLTKMVKFVVVSYFIDEREHNYRSELASLGVNPDLVKYALRCPYAEIDRLLSY